jgi:Fic family protein
MAGFIEWYQANEAKMPPVELAAGAYQRLVSIHPFMDANGRTCRMVMDWVLRKHGLPPAAFMRGEENVAVFYSDRAGSGVTPAQAVQAVTTAIERSLDIMSRSVQEESHR